MPSSPSTSLILVIALTSSQHITVHKSDLATTYYAKKILLEHIHAHLCKFNCAFLATKVELNSGD